MRLSCDNWGFSFLERLAISMSETTSNDDSLPWFVKAIMTIAALVVLFVVVIDLATFAVSL